MNYNVKSVKFFKGHDGLGMNCNLYNGSKKIAEIHDEAYGGHFDYRWLDKSEKKDFEQFVTTLGEYEIDGINIPYDADIYVDELVKTKEVN